MNYNSELDYRVALKQRERVKPHDRKIGYRSIDSLIQLCITKREV